MTKKIILIVLIVILLTVISQGKSPVINWYEIEEWEVEFCNKWGGKQTPSEIEITSGSFSYGTASMTLQAKKMKGLNETYYEIGYYIEPFSREMHYELYMVDEEKELSYRVNSGTLGVSAGVSDYQKLYLPEDYKELKLIHSTGELKVPIIEVGE